MQRFRFTITCEIKLTLKIESKIVNKEIEIKLEKLNDVSDTAKQKTNIRKQIQNIQCCFMKMILHKQKTKIQT